MRISLLAMVAFGITAASGENIFGCSGDKIALKSAGNEKYVYASKNGKVYANQKDKNTYETFTVEELGGDKIALISFHGKYLVAEAGIYVLGIEVPFYIGKGSYNINADRLERKSYETFTVEHHAGGTIALKTAHKRYVGPMDTSLDLFSFWDLRAKSKKVGTDEKFSVECQAIDYSCNKNDWDSRQYCLCKPGYKLKDFESDHDNGKEDRQWTLRCEKINDNFAVEESDYPNRVGWTNWDAPINYVFANQDLYSGFLVGTESFHDNGKEDRRFIFFYTKINRDIYELKDCEWKKMNNWDEKMEVRLTDNQVYGGIKSKHDNQKEDREWYAYVCNLEKRKQ